MGLADRKIISYIGDTSDVEAKLRRLQVLNAKLGTTLGKDMNKGFKQVGPTQTQVSTKESSKTLKELNNTATKTSETFKNTKGQMIQMTKTSKVNAKGIRTTTTSYKDLNNTTASLGQNIERLTSRALLTIPLWLALRGAVMGFISAIKNGFSDLIKFDKVLQKLKRNIQGTPGQIAKGFSQAQSTITEFSLESGRSVEEITNAIQKFATVGFDLDTSISAGIDSVKLAVLLFGEGASTANAFARSLRVMTEDLTTSAEKQKAISGALALTSELWETNAFEVDEFSGNLEKFAGTAKIANLSIEETLALLATLSTGGLANRGGRLLRSTLLKSLADIGKVTKSLDLSFDPKTQPTIVFITELINKLKTLKSPENVPVELAGTLGDLFTVRGTEVLGALTALEKTLKANLALTPDIKAFNNGFVEQTETLNVLAQKYHNYNKEIGKAFVTGVVGGKNFEESLKDVGEAQKKATTGALDFGNTLRLIAKYSPAQNAFVVSFKEYIQILKKVDKQTQSTFNSIQSGLSDDITPIDLSKIIIGLNKSDDVFKNLNFDKTLATLSGKLSTSLEGIRSQILLAMSEGLEQADLEKLLKNLDGVDFQLLNLDSAQFEKIYKAVDIALKTINTKIKSSNEKGKYKIPIGVDVDPTKLKEINQKIIDSYISQKKEEGTLDSLTIKRRTELEKIFGINQDRLTLIDRELEKERALTKEKKLQSTLGSDSIKLFKIAQEHGTATARKLSDVLSGKRDFGGFVGAGGKDLDIFKEQFGDKFEQKQAQQFYKGESVSGVKGLYGGQTIGIEEQGIRGLTSSRSQLEAKRLADKALRGSESRQTTVNQTNNVPITMKIDVVNTEKENLGEKIIDVVSKEIKKYGSKINNAFNKAQSGNQISNK